MLIGTFTQMQETLVSPSIYVLFQALLLVLISIALYTNHYDHPIFITSQSLLGPLRRPPDVAERDDSVGRE